MFESLHCSMCCSSDSQRESNASVIVVMEQAGFQTKSNFNREFRRITGLTPTAWRSRHSEQAEIVP